MSRSILSRAATPRHAGHAVSYVHGPAAAAAPGSPPQQERRDSWRLLAAGAVAATVVRSVPGGLC